MGRCRRVQRRADEAIAAYNRIVGLDLDEVPLDGSQHKAPCGGDGTGPNCTGKGRLGWKWSLATDRYGIPIGWVAAPANRHDAKLVAATLDDIEARGLLIDIDTIHFDRGYAFEFVRTGCAERGITDVQVPKTRRRNNTRRKIKQIIPLGPARASRDPRAVHNSTARPHPSFSGVYYEQGAGMSTTQLEGGNPTSVDRNRTIRLCSLGPAAKTPALRS